MAKRDKNTSLHQAKQQRYDEFYTQRSDIDRELAHYQAHFRGKTVLCNCDDPRVSNFFKYFASNFRVLGLERLIATCYKSNNAELFSTHDAEQAVYIDYRGEGIEHNDWLKGEIPVKKLEGDGSFDSEECIELLQQADIVVTNPPFSLFREYMATLFKYNKKFLVIGNKNAITYKEIFPLIASNRLWTGVRGFAGGMWFEVTIDCPNYDKEEGGKKLKNVPSIWFTNLEHRKRNEELILVKKYNPEDYPNYDNYDAINVDKVADIPCDYTGGMGVPITFLDKYNPQQFEILGATESEGVGFSNGLWNKSSKVAQPLVFGERKYKRLFIRFRKEYFETHQS